MASINISKSSYTTSSRTITVNYTVDITLTNIQISKDGVNFINAISFSQTTATFNVSTWENGTYDNCFLRGYYTDSNLEVIYGEIVLNNTLLTVNEGSFATFTVKLDKAPTNNQTVIITCNDLCVETDKQNLIFTPLNYNVAQIVTVIGHHDASVYENQTGIISLSSPNVSSKSITVTVKNIDDSSVTSYMITKKYTKCNEDNFVNSINSGTSYTNTITPASGYIIESIIVTMGGVDITSSVVFDNVINITSVTGDIEITAIATEISIPIEDNLVYFGDNNDIPTDEDLIYFEDGDSVYFEDK